MALRIATYYASLSIAFHGNGRLVGRREHIAGSVASVGSGATPTCQGLLRPRCLDLLWGFEKPDVAHVRMTAPTLMALKPEMKVL